MLFAFKHRFFWTWVRIETLELETLNQTYSVNSIAYNYFIAINKGNEFSLYVNYSKYEKFDKRI